MAPASTTPAFRTSGDLLADRRYAYAEAALAEGDAGAAADLAEQALELAPGFAPAWALLGRARRAQGAPDAAAQALMRALALEPDDALGVRLDLAGLGRIPPEAAIGEGYVRALFDQYADRFEAHLTGELAYRGPALIRDALERVCAAAGRPVAFRRALDLGCGTGLMARALGPCAEVLVGVDLSPRMVALAQRTGLYADLAVGPLEPFLAAQEPGRADLILAADVFVYLAALDGVFRAAARALAPGGLLAFTVQAHPGDGDGDGVVLGEDARYAHGAAHLRRAAADAGLATALLEDAATRTDRGRPVPGRLVVLRRDAVPPPP